MENELSSLLIKLLFYVAFAKMQQSLLWKISNPLLHHDSYLFGSIHVKSPLAFRQIDLIQEKIDECTAFAAEMALDEVNNSLEMALAFRAEQGKDLLTLLGTKKYQKVRALLLRSMDFDLNHFRQLRPLFISGIIDEQLMPKGDAALALDHHLWNYAKSQDKLLFGLESLQDQIDVLKHIAPEEEKKAFLGAVKNISNHRKSIQKMMQWYEQQDIKQLYKASKKSLGKWRYHMLIKRNYQMAATFHELNQAQSLFAAVGTAHLAGKEGVLRLLKLQGYKIKAV